MKFLPLKFDKYGLTLIDHDNHTCVVISNVNREHSGFWSCELDSAMTHANLIIKTGEMSNPITQPTHYISISWHTGTYRLAAVIAQPTHVNFLLFIRHS